MKALSKAILQPAKCHLDVAEMRRRNRALKHSEEEIQMMLDELEHVNIIPGPAELELAIQQVLDQFDGENGWCNDLQEFLLGPAFWDAMDRAWKHVRNGDLSGA